MTITSFNCFCCRIFRVGRSGMILAFAALLSTPVIALDIEFKPGKGKFIFDEWSGKPIRIHYSFPESITRNTTVLLVMHGASRNPETYRDEWHELAQQNNVIVLAPDFSRTAYPGRSYILGNIADTGGKPIAKELWAFSALEPLFDAVRDALKLKVKHYSLFGHSGGAQFSHRFLYFVPENRAKRIVLANAGWYTMPLYTASYPHGLLDAPISEEDLSTAYKRRVVVLLGDEDTDPEHKSLNRQKETMKQGRTRFSRGHRFYLNSALRALKLKAEFNWSLSVVSGVGHSNAGMIPQAMPLLLDGPLDIH